MKATAKCQAAHVTALVTRTGIGQDTRVNVGNTRCDRHCLRATVQAQKTCERRAALTLMADFTSQACDEIDLAAETADVEQMNVVDGAALWLRNTWGYNWKEM